MSPVAPQVSGLEASASAAASGRLQTESDLLVLLREHGPKVKGVLLLKYSNLLCSEDLDEILSAALQRAWEHRLAFNPAKASLRTWFFCIAQRLAVDRLKLSWHKASRQEISWEMLPSAQNGAVAAEIDLETEAEADEAILPTESGLHTSLAEALASLSEVQRCIVWADALGAGASGVTSETLGAELGLPAGTVRVYRKRAMEKLRAFLQPVWSAVQAQAQAKRKKTTQLSEEEAAV